MWKYNLSEEELKILDDNFSIGENYKGTKYTFPFTIQGVYVITTTTQPGKLFWIEWKDDKYCIKQTTEFSLKKKQIYKTNSFETLVKKLKLILNIKEESKEV